MRCLIVGAGQSGLVLAHALLSHGVDVTVITSRSSEDLRWGRAQLTQLTLPHGLAVEASHNLSRWEGAAPAFDRVSLNVIPEPGQSLGFTGALVGIGMAVDPRVKRADLLECFEDRGGKVAVHGLTVSDLEYFTRPHRMYDLVLLAVGDGELGQILETDHSRTTTRERVITQAYVTGLRAPEDEVQVYSCPSGEVYVVPTLSMQGAVHAVTLIARPGSALDCSASDVRITQPEAVLRRMITQLHQAHIPLWEPLRRSELLDSSAVLIKRIRPVVRQPVHVFDHGGALLGVGDTVLTVPPQCGQEGEASVRSAQLYADRILSEDGIGHALDADFLRATFLAYMEHSGRHIDVFEKYVDAFWTGRLTEAEQALFQQACTDQSTADAYVAGFADPEQLVRLLQTPRT